MAIRGYFRAGLVAAALALAGCGGPESGPVRVSAVGGAPSLANPNLRPLDPPAAFVTETVAQGLVRFDGTGEVEPALAQSWVVSDDGLRYTFRIRRTTWADGSPVTARQVALRLRAALSRASRNPFKPVLGAIDSIEPMTDFVLEIGLRGPRPNFLQLLAHPEMSVMENGLGTGPYRLRDGAPAGVVRLEWLRGEDEETPADRPDLLLRGERTARAVARFAADETDLVIGGTIGDLAIARAADIPAARFAFDPVGGMFGLAFGRNSGPLGDRALRRALAMAVDRDELAAALGAPRLATRTSLVAPGVQELPAPVQPNWAGLPLEARRNEAARIVAGIAPGARLRVSTPEGPGYRLVFAHLRRDWRLIGIEAERVGPGAPADLILLDEVAPANLASWYLRHFACDSSAICDAAADQALLAARLAPLASERQAQFATADRILNELVAFIPLTAPVRWSLVSQRLTGFRPNSFARHPAETLIAERP